MDMASICKRDIVSVDRAASLQQAARLMREHHVGALVVTAETPQGHQVSGVVTDRGRALPERWVIEAQTGALVEAPVAAARA